MSGAPRPFHVTEEPLRAYSRRLLVITEHFPPGRAVGGLRWQKMSQFAAERGWGTDVVCLDPAFLADRDDERMADLPPGMRVYGVPHPGPVGDGALNALVTVAQRLRRARSDGGGASSGATAAQAVPQATGSVARADVGAMRPWSPRDVLRAVTSLQFIGGELRWVRALVDVAQAVVGPTHAAVISSGPPHFAHEAARRVARATGLPLVLDFRDPWSVTERVPVGLASPVYFNRVARYERRAIDAAALVVCNTELAARAVRTAYPAASDRIVAVMNGSDDEPRPDVARDPRFLVVYTGAIYFDRDPRLLFRAAARVIAELQLEPSQFGIELMGPVDAMSPPVELLARQEGVEAFVKHHPSGPRAAASRLLASASLLVSLPQDTETAIPSKIFEYSTFDAWLLALAHPHSASGLVLAGSSADVVGPTDVDGIADVLRRHYLEYASGVRPRAVGADGRFSRARQAALLLDQLERVTAR